MKFSRAAWSHATVIACSVAFGGCGDSSDTTAPVVAGGSRARIELSSSVANGQIVKRTINLNDDITVSATITKQDGGYIQIAEAGLYVVVPKNAVAEDLVITATAHKGNKIVYSFEPHGTVFSQPIYVVQEIRFTELNTPRSAKNRPNVWAGYLEQGLLDITEDGKGKFSEVFDGLYYGKGNDALAYFATTHFSGYAMASGRREAP